MTTLVPLAVGVFAAPHEVRNGSWAWTPLEVTVIRSAVQSTVETWESPMLIDSVRLSSNASPAPALRPCTGMFILIVESCGQ